MKILQVVPGISPRFGGPSVALTDLTRLLTQQGIETTLITTNADPKGRVDVPLGVPVEQRGAKVIYYNVWPRGRYAFSLSFAQALSQTISNYDVVHIHWLYNFSPLITAFLARRAGVPYVLQLNGSLDPNLLKKNNIIKKVYLFLFGNYIIKNASAIIFTTEAERRLAALDSFQRPSHVVPVGLDWLEYKNLPPFGQFRKTWPNLGDKRIVLFLGRMSHQKGLDLLIPAFRKVADRHPKAHLVLVGPDGEGYGARVRQWVAEANLDSRVTFTGRVPDKLKLAAYVDSDVYVLSSHAENFGATVTEALACQKPVVITNRVNICDEVAAAEAGIVVDCSVDSVADGINRVLDDYQLAKRLAENGWELVKQKFTWEAAFKQLIPIYRDLMDKV